MHRANISSNIMSRMGVFENALSVGKNENISTGRFGRLKEAVDHSGRTILETTEGVMMMSTPPTGVQTDADGLILPKKLINPCLESDDRKQLHRELKFNTKIGKSVLNQKSELQKAYEKQREMQKHQIQQDLSPTSNLNVELNRVIKERSQKHELHQHIVQNVNDDDRQYINPEYLNVRAKLKSGQRPDLK